MSAKVVWDGMREFQEALRSLPEDLAKQAGTIVEAHALDAHRSIQANYPEGPTGILRGRVRVTREGLGNLGRKVVVRSAAPHAHLFEAGTKQRKTRTGVNRGRMRPAPDSQRMIPQAQRARRRMIQALIAMMEDNGLQVRR